MAPKRRPVNVVRSGNAGNSSKPTKPKDEKDGANPDAPARPPPLFPIGYKSPVTILNEKCQKAGWERPIIETKQNPRSNPETFGGVVILRKRTSKNVYDLDTVRFTPHPPLDIDNAAMAKHYLATYALFRFLNHLPLALTLPPTIRPYWTTLLAEKSAAPAHRDWEWAPDPFAAKHEVEARQTKKKEKDEAVASGSATPGGSGSGHPSGRSTPVNDGRRGGKVWENAPEVRMAPALREVVEGTVKKLMKRFPSAIMDAARETEGTPAGTPGASGTNTPSLDTKPLQTQLETLGFRPAHITSALSAVAAAHARLQAGGVNGADPLVLSLSILSPLEAAIEWLLLHLPEDDLPPRYRPSSSASDMVTGGSASKGGKSALVRGWTVDKLVRKAGFPRKAVEAAIATEDRESLTLELLGRRLVGWKGEDAGWGDKEVVEWGPDAAADEERQVMRDEEVMALEAMLGERFRRGETPSELIVDIESGSDTLHLHVVLDEHAPYPSAQHPTRLPPFYLTSPSLPSYMRLHLHADMLLQFRDPQRHDLVSVLEAGTGGAILMMVEHLETTLPTVVENPPDIANVTQHLIPRVEDDEPDRAPREAQRKAPKQHSTTRRREPTAAEKEAVVASQKALFANPEYKPMLAARERLPAWKERDNICDALAKNRVLVVVGETGCGKSTQLPQFILDREIAEGRGASTNIIVTQPRRVAAMGVAARVAQERLEDVEKNPGSVGYAIRGEARRSRDTRLLFCTTGIVLRRLGTGDADLSNVSHVIVDEAHERGVDTDLLICLLRDLLERNKTIKVVLMSATINEQIFIDYFGGCPSLKIPGFTYPVQDHYLEDVVPLIKYQPTPSRYGPKLNEDQKAAMRADYEKLGLAQDDLRALEIISQSDRIDYGLVAATVQHIVRTAPDTKGAILIFMPGVMEIRQCIAELQNADLGLVEILALHANLSSAEQRRVFIPTAPKRKIVVATNVAETSVTIDDVVYVVDSGRVKETQYDADNGMQRLVECWTSRASGRQRRGRAGRTQPGQCYKLYSHRTENNSMPRFPVPEILRTPLEALFLQVKAMNEETDVKAFLGKAIDPPKMDAIDSAWQTLIDLGAVESEKHTSKLTAMGRHMSMIPVDLRLAKMMVLGTIFKCLDTVLTIAALLSSKPLFTSPIDRRDDAKRAREAFTTSRSDLLTDARAYHEVAALRGSAARSFCEKNFISPSTVRDITSLRQDFISALSSLGFISSSAAGLARVSTNVAKDNLVKAVIVGGLYPRVARIALPDAQYERVQQGAIAKEHEAKEVKFFDQAGRVFLHPSSVLFSVSGWKRGYLAYFSKAETSKVFLRDATDVPLYGLLLFGGQITVNHWAGGLMLGKDGHVKLRAATRIGVLCAQLRRLLDAELAELIESPHGAADLREDVTGAMMALLARDGLTQ
ncbi:Putative DEAH-box ATP-dependent helicase [Vanrija pseudolonga]|uniref:RNA helicase n=1 Tax=Vanrija pseudolonga TaxID=143232 RepID=A0AAF0Y5Z7_9TREE|nr:Putative DEAH-box ATP-dependent helicase [Vanrija pseudolonga]